jgi:hypothetical protein
MAGQQGLGRLFNVVPIAAGAGLYVGNVSAVTFICTGNDTYTITCASTFAGSYATPGNIITQTYTSTATNGTAAWVKNAVTATNAPSAASGTIAFSVFGSQLPDPKKYVKVSVGASGLVMAILHDLTYQRAPANLQIVSA